MTAFEDRTFVANSIYWKNKTFTPTQDPEAPCLAYLQR